MSRSSLSLKISFVELVETLSDDGCVEVIRLLQKELGSHTLNKAIIQIFMQCGNLTDDCVTRMTKKIKENYSQHPRKVKTAPAIKDNKHNRKDVIFPLFSLPIDLITTTSIFLDETDILKFEQCCRLFYKMVNNTLYLTKCYNFKRFSITNKILDTMKQDKQ